MPNIISLLGKYRPDENISYPWMVGILKLERKIASVDEDMEKLELLDMVCGKTKWFIRFWKQFGGSSKAKA